MISQADLKTRNDKQLLKLLSEEEIAGGRDMIRNTPGVNKLFSLPEEELRSMGAEKNAQKLVSRYKKELARNKQKKKKKGKTRITTKAHLPSNGA